MAKFEGTFTEFKHFIGPMLRNTVQTLTKKYKSRLGKCNHCGSTDHLEAAHIQGQDRNLLIKTILDGYTENYIISIDLQQFEERFKEEHRDLDGTILILCKACHKKYEGARKTSLKDQDHYTKIKTNNIVSGNRLFTNKDIQIGIVRYAKLLPITELNQLCDVDVSKKIFNISFPVFKKIPRTGNENLLNSAIKDNQGYNRWTWRYKFEKDGYIYAITTQWYSRSDSFVKEWLNVQAKRNFRSEDA